MVDAELVDRLADDLLDDVRDDWVSVMAMVWSCEQVLHMTDLHEIEEVITATLVRLIDHPDVKVLDGDMVRVFADPVELAQHIHHEWPRSGDIPVSGDVVWLVERDFELRQPMRPV